MCGCLSHAPNWGPGPQPRHVPWLGIELATLCFSGPCSIHWVTPARANFLTRNIESPLFSSRWKRLPISHLVSLQFRKYLISKYIERKVNQHLADHIRPQICVVWWLHDLKHEIKCLSREHLVPYRPTTPWGNLLGLWRHLKLTFLD